MDRSADAHAALYYKNIEQMSRENNGGWRFPKHWTRPELFNDT
jgi:hypothetical protein